MIRWTSGYAVAEIVGRPLAAPFPINVLPTICLLLGCCMCASMAMAASDAFAGPVVASVSQPAVARFVVRFRPGLAGPENGTIRSSLLEELQGLLGQSLSASPSTSARNYVLRLQQPVSLREAMRLVGVLRMRTDVVYAELDPRERQHEVAVKAAATQGSGQPTIRRLMVTFAEPMLAVKSRNNEQLGAEWDDKLSASAGVPIHVVRATVAGAWVVELLAAVDVSTAEAIATRLQAAGIARLAMPDYVLAPTLTPNDPVYVSGAQWNLSGPDAQPSRGINVPQAWDITTGSPDIVIAVVDSGIVPHPELTNRILAGYNFISDPVRAGNGVGRSNDATDLGDWRTLGLCPAPNDQPADSSWHGTLVTGVVAATSNNGIGMAGVDWHARVLPVRVLGKCGGNTLDIIEAIEWAAGLPVPGVPSNPTPANVINLSFGGKGPCPHGFQEVIDLLLDAGVFIAAAAGNDSADVADHNPANCHGLTTVGATDPHGMRASYSNFGLRVDISAPGGDGKFYGIEGAIYSTSNSGTRGARSPNYKYEDGTSVATPHVAGVASLMMAVNHSLFPAQIKQLMAQTASPFAAGSVCLTGICGAGIVNAYAAVRAAQTATPAPPTNYEGLWWNAPAATESGWGINFAHQGDVIFATWFTYDATGKAWWLFMTATKITNNTFSGTLYETHGPPFNTIPFNPNAVTTTSVGTGMLTFSRANDGIFQYTVRGIAQAKAITRQVFGALPTCTFGAQTDLTLATNYQDLWWAAPAGVESGWGVNFAHQSDIIFATWFTYDFDGTPLWLSATLLKTERAGEYKGALIRTTGPPFNAVPFLPANVSSTPVGTLTVTFANGNSATFAYTLNGATQSKQIVRQVFRTPGTVCQ